MRDTVLAVSSLWGMESSTVLVMVEVERLQAMQGQWFSNFGVYLNDLESH